MQITAKRSRSTNVRQTDSGENFNIQTKKDGTKVAHSYDTGKFKRTEETKHGIIDEDEVDDLNKESGR